ncbi:hypothetical protein A2U01_0025340 [Trifolium medium]|uniref:Uncharacterized protein n=1 Tax=Trifolium medium TaxID=97028 RepID=A0A392NWV9_9FABA|nr:hypothetical protein [Trifolium medium]
MENQHRKSPPIPSKTGTQHLQRGSTGEIPRTQTSSHDKLSQSSSRFSGGSVLCCSSIKSADIIQCNEKIRKRRETEVASKLWNTAKKFGVGCEDETKGDSDYVQQIIQGEKVDRMTKVTREQKSRVNS